MFNFQARHLWSNLKRLLPELPYTDALLAPSDATLAYPGCAILLDGQKTWLSRQIHCPLLPDSSSHPGCKGAKKSVGGGQKRVRVRYFLCSPAIGSKNRNRMNSVNCKEKAWKNASVSTPDPSSHTILPSGADLDMASHLQSSLITLAQSSHTGE